MINKLRDNLNALNQRDKRALMLGAAAILLTIVYVVLLDPWVTDWRITRGELKARRQKMAFALKDTEAGYAAKQAGLLSVVPAFEMPQEENEQSILFRDAFNEQLKKSGINVKSLKFLRAKTSKTDGYRLKPLQCSGKCKLDQALDLLVILKENPYLAGIDEFRLKVDQKNRKEVELDITVSTFVK